MNEAAVKIYTIGYQNITIEDFCRILTENEITAIADIRENPYSRNRDFSQKAIIAHLQKAGIAYFHFKALGSPPDLRREVRENHDYKRFFEQYTNHLNTQSDTLAELNNIIYDNTICLLCYEHDIAICHRRIVAEKLAELAEAAGPVEIIHL